LRGGAEDGEARKKFTVEEPKREYRQSKQVSERKTGYFRKKKKKKKASTESARRTVGKCFREGKTVRGAGL